MAITNSAAQLQLQAADAQQARTIVAQVGADAARQRTQRWKITQDLQTALLRITTDVTVHKAKTADKAFDAMDRYLRG